MSNTITILTSDIHFGDNLKEILELEGFNVCLFQSVNFLLVEKKPIEQNILIVDEFNLKNSYNNLSKIWNSNYAKTFLVVLSEDRNSKKYPLANACMSIPTNIDELVAVANTNRNGFLK